jgi:hypothetical protein
VEYKKAHAALTEELQALEEISAAKDLIMAKLETLAGFAGDVPLSDRAAARARRRGARATEEPLFDPRVIADDGETFECVLEATAEEPPAGGKVAKILAPIGGAVSGGADGRTRMFIRVLNTGHRDLAVHLGLPAAEPEPGSLLQHLDRGHPRDRVRDRRHPRRRTGRAG